MRKWIVPCLVIAVSVIGCRHSEELVLMQEQELQAPEDPGFGYQAKGQGLSLEEWVKFTGGWAPEGTGAGSEESGTAVVKDETPALTEMGLPDLFELPARNEAEKEDDVKDSGKIPEREFQIISDGPAEDIPEIKILDSSVNHIEEESGISAITGQGEVWINEENDPAVPEEAPNTGLSSEFEGGAVMEEPEDISDPGPAVYPDVIDEIRKSAEEAQQERPSLFQTLFEKYFFVLILVCFSLIVFGLARVLLITSGGSKIEDSKKKKKHQGKQNHDFNEDQNDYSVNLTGIQGGSVAAISRTLGGADMESVQKSAEEIMLENERKRNPEFEWNYIDPVSPPPEGVENEEKIKEMFDND